MQPRSAILLFITAIALVIISCDVSTLAGSPAEAPTPIPGSLNLFIAQTAGAAATQTARLIPPTLTPSFTPYPTFTPPDTDTPSPTFIFILFTPTSGGGGGGGNGTTGTAGSDFACSKLSKSPADGTQFSTGQKFTGSWKVKNSGTADWPSTSV